MTFQWSTFVDSFLGDISGTEIGKSLDFQSDNVNLPIVLHCGSWNLGRSLVLLTKLISFSLSSSMFNSLCSVGLCDVYLHAAAMARQAAGLLTSLTGGHGHIRCQTGWFNMATRSYFLSLPYHAYLAHHVFFWYGTNCIEIISCQSMPRSHLI